jgi:endonuclease YncB( thermonuclease family)
VTARHARRRGTATAIAVGVLAFLTGAVLAYTVGPRGAAPAAAAPSSPPAPSASAPAPVPPAVMVVRSAVVTAVDDGQSVHVDHELDPIRIDGIDAPTGTACGAPDSTSHARRMMLGQRVTLVPDTAMPDAGEHVVLPTQLSYTDDALSSGYARAAPGAWTYAAAFQREEASARDAHAGLWSGCWA